MAEYTPAPPPRSSRRADEVTSHQVWGHVSNGTPRSSHRARLRDLENGDAHSDRNGHAQSPSQASKWTPSSSRTKKHDPAMSGFAGCLIRYYKKVPEHLWVICMLVFVAFLMIQQESARRKLDIRLEKIVAGLREERRIRMHTDLMMSHVMNTSPGTGHAVSVNNTALMEVQDEFDRSVGGLLPPLITKELAGVVDRYSISDLQRGGNPSSIARRPERRIFWPPPFLRFGKPFITIRVRRHPKG